MRVIVCGSRRWDDRKRIADRLFDLRSRTPRSLSALLTGTGLARENLECILFDLGLATENLECIVVHGNAAGADRIAAQEAEKLGLLVEAHDYRQFISPTCSPKRAPLERNSHMARLGADLCICFWDGQSTGTQDMWIKAAQAGIPVEVIEL